MKYYIEYQNGGSTKEAIDINNLIQNMRNHIELFDSYFGENKWAFTGSYAVVFYANKYRPDLLQVLDNPNDIDIIVETDERYIMHKSIGNYINQNNTLVKSSTFTNEQNESIDVLYEKKIKKVDIDGIPLISIDIIHDRYSDFFARSNDQNKQMVVGEIMKNIQPTSLEIEESKYSKTDRDETKVARTLF